MVFSNAYDFIMRLYKVQRLFVGNSCSFVCKNWMASGVLRLVPVGPRRIRFPQKFRPRFQPQPAVADYRRTISCQQSLPGSWDRSELPPDRTKATSPTRPANSSYLLFPPPKGAELLMGDTFSVWTRFGNISFHRQYGNN